MSMLRGHLLGWKLGVMARNMGVASTQWPASQGDCVLVLAGVFSLPMGARPG